MSEFYQDGIITNFHNLTRRPVEELFRTAGAEVCMSVLCNLGGDDILRSIAGMKEHIRRSLHRRCKSSLACTGFW